MSGAASSSDAMDSDQITPRAATSAARRVPQSPHGVDLPDGYDLEIIDCWELLGCSPVVYISDEELAEYLGYSLDTIRTNQDMRLMYRYGDVERWPTLEDWTTKLHTAIWVCGRPPVQPSHYWGEPSKEEMAEYQEALQEYTARLEKVRSELANCTDFHIRDSNGHTVLHTAVVHALPNLIPLLLAARTPHSIDVNAAAETPRRIRLIGNGDMEPQLGICWGLTALDVAILGLVDPDGVNHVDSLLRVREPPASDEHFEEMIALLLQAGASLMQPSGDGLTAAERWVLRSSNRCAEKRDGVVRRLSQEQAIQLQDALTAASKRVSAPTFRPALTQEERLVIQRASNNCDSDFLEMVDPCGARDLIDDVPKQTAGADAVSSVFTTVPVSFIEASPSGAARWHKLQEGSWLESKRASLLHHVTGPLAAVSIITQQVIRGSSAGFDRKYDFELADAPLISGVFVGVSDALPGRSVYPRHYHEHAAVVQISRTIPDWQHGHELFFVGMQCSSVKSEHLQILLAVVPHGSAYLQRCHARFHPLSWTDNPIFSVCNAAPAGAASSAATAAASSSSSSSSALWHVGFRYQPAKSERRLRVWVNIFVPGNLLMQRCSTVPIQKNGIALRPDIRVPLQTILNKDTRFLTELESLGQRKQ